MRVCREAPTRGRGEREIFIGNLLVRIHFIIEMIWWTGLAPWEFEASTQPRPPKNLTPND